MNFSVEHQCREAAWERWQRRHTVLSVVIGLSIFYLLCASYLLGGFSKAVALPFVAVSDLIGIVAAFLWSLRGLIIVGIALLILIYVRLGHIRRRQS